jgi:hypothetical protein
MNVEMREGLALHDDSRDAIHPGQDRPQARLHLEHNLGTQRGKLGQIADELKGVTEALFGVHQDNLPGESLATKPKRLREVATLVPLAFGFPTPFVLLPAALEVSKQ